MGVQINPPFDGSAPCPMCSTEVRSLSAYAHNMMNRWRKGEELPEPKFWVKLDDLTLCAAGEPGFADPSKRGLAIDAIETDNAQVRVHLDAIAAIIIEYRKHARPSSHDTARPVAAALSPLVERLRETQPVIGLLSEAHFADERHSSGRVNILREQHGYSPDRGGEYNWTVDVAQTPETGDLRHDVCGTGLMLHEHFRERLRADRAFYGQIWCPTCRLNAPSGQFSASAAAD